MTDSPATPEATEEEVAEWRVITHGAQCRDCGGFARPRVVKKLPNGKPHPHPYRFFTCQCGRHWRTSIPDSSLVRDNSRNDSRNV